MSLVNKILGGSTTEKAVIALSLLYFNRELFLKSVAGPNSVQLSGLLYARCSISPGNTRVSKVLVPDHSLESKVEWRERKDIDL